MKWSSLLTAACAAALISVPARHAEAIDPTGGAIPRPNTVPTQPQNPLDYSPGFNDPFFNAFNNGLNLPGNSGYAIPVAPPGTGFPLGGTTQPGIPGTTTQPQTQPGTLPQGRTRTDQNFSNIFTPGGTNPQLAPNYVPPGTGATSSPRRWRLGVYSQDLETGVKIMQIVAGGAAARARLEPEDVIVAVNGYQVGYVNGQLFDCSSEFERHATRDGWVTMLIQNRRDRSLVNVPVQLDPRFQTLNGSLSLDRRVQLPTDSIISVELKEIVRPGSEPITVASNKITSVPSAYPIPFEIEYDPVSIDSRRNYVVTAAIQSRNRVLYETVQQFPAFQPGTGKNVTIQLASVSTQQPFDPTLVQYDRDAQIAQIVNYFQQYLGRPPKDSELIAFLSRLDSNNYSLSDVQLDLLGHNQFFNRCDADKKKYIERLHEFMVGRQPRPEELEYWMARYDASGGLRRGFVSEFQQATTGISH